MIRFGHVRTQVGDIRIYMREAFSDLDRITDHKPIVALLSIFIVILTAVFVWATHIGGYTWDEFIHLHGISRQAEITVNWLTGHDDVSFRDMQRDKAFYGPVAIAPAFIAGVIADYVAGPASTWIEHRTLHTTAFVCGVLVVVLVYILCRQLALPRSFAVLGTFAFALYPLWLGYSFFDYKDIPIAAFVLLGIVCTNSLVSAKTESRMTLYAVLLAVATGLLGGSRVAGIALLLPAILLAVVFLARRRMWRPLFVYITTSLLLVLLFNPVGWNEPIAFLYSSLTVMSDHPWSGCTLTMGSCLAPQEPGWSAGGYLLKWSAVQVPILVAVLMLLAPLVLVRRRSSVSIFLIISIGIPIVMIVGRNSTLYDGLRHVLFLAPLIFVLAWWSLYNGAHLIRRTGIAYLLISIQLVAFIADNVALFPYNYTYFNYGSRHFIDESVFETDFWGYSLREATGRALRTEKDIGYVVGRPGHLVAPFLSKGVKMISSEESGGIAAGQRYYHIAYTRKDYKVPGDCVQADFVSRSLPFSMRELTLSFAASCKAK